MSDSSLPQNKPVSSEILSRAHVMPFAVYIGFSLILQLVTTSIGWKHPNAPWWRQDPALWLYPIQAIVTFAVILYFRKYYEFRFSWKWVPIAVLFGIIGISAWLLPTHLYDMWHLEGPTSGWMHKLGIDSRRGAGFNPHIIENPIGFWSILLMRFFRAAIVVALLEEIFWRGFLMRLSQNWNGNFWKVPFGKHAWISFLVVTAAFTFAHSAIDYAGAIVYGTLTYLLCIWCKRLSACIIMHGTANFLLGLYIMHTGKYGLW